MPTIKKTVYTDENGYFEALVEVGGGPGIQNVTVKAATPNTPTSPDTQTSTTMTAPQQQPAPQSSIQTIDISNTVPSYATLHVDDTETTAITINSPLTQTLSIDCKEASVVLVLSNIHKEHTAIYHIGYGLSTLKVSEICDETTRYISIINAL